MSTENAKPSLIGSSIGKAVELPVPVRDSAPEVHPDFKRLLEKEWTPSQGVFQDPTKFAHAQRVATMLIESKLAPDIFRGKDNLGSAVIAVDMAFRLNMNPLMVMQQLYVVHGKPGWSAQFVIAVINASGRFTPIRFKFTGDGDHRQCVAYSKDIASGEVLEGTPVSIALAKKEGWFQKTGSKWQSMSEQMLAYRAASFWGRIYAPEMFMGLPTADELDDMAERVSNAKPTLVDKPEEHAVPVTVPTKPAASATPKPSKAERLHKPQPPATEAQTEMQRQEAVVQEIQKPVQPVPAPEATAPPAVVVMAPPSESAILLAQGIVEMGIPEDDFLSWVNGTGRFKGADKLAGIADLPPEVCASILADPARLAKCKRIYGTKTEPTQEAK